MTQLLVLVALLISYGSVYPFGFEARPIDTAQLVAFLSTYYGPTTLSNVVANIVLFAPFGFLAPLAAREYRRPRWALGLFVMLGAVLAVALQVVQLWLPGRVPALGDALLNFVGMAFGLGAGLLFDHRRLDGAREIARTAALAPIMLALLWIAYRWFPLVPTLDLQNVKDSLKPLLLRPAIDPVRVLHDAVAWLAFFRLLAFTPARALSPMWLAVGAIVVVAAQPLFAGNTISANNVAGVALALACLPVLGRHYASALIVAAMLVTLLLVGLQPYRMAAVPNTFHWIPFTGYLDGSMATNALNLVYKGYFYGTAVFLLRDCGSRPLASALTVAIWLAAIEALQIWVAGRTAEVTDPLFALMLGWVLSRFDATARTQPVTSHRRAHGASPRIRTAQTGRPQ